MANFEVFAVTMVVDCEFCKLAVPIHHLEAQTTCPHCQKSFNCDWKKGGRFGTALVEQLERAVETKKTRSTDTVLSVQVDKVNDIPCENCKDPIRLPTSIGQSLVCGSCKGLNNINQVNQPGGIDYIVNGLSAGEHLVLGDHSVSCISCGGNVPVNGNSRAVICPFCSRETIVSDALWQKLHPEIATKPFYLLIANLKGLEDEASETHDPNRIIRLADHFYFKIRVAVASNPHLPESTARMLMKDHNGSVANKLRGHPKFKKWFAPKDIFMDMQEAKQFALEFPVETDPGLSEEEMIGFAKQKMPRRLIALAYNESLTKEVMKQIIKQKVEPALIVLSKRTDLDQEILRLLVNCDSRQVNEIVAVNNILPLQSIQRLSNSNEKIILKALLENSNTPTDIKAKVKQKLDLLK